MKLEFFQEGCQPKHLRDIAGVLAQQEIDMAFIRSATDDLSLAAEWADALKLAGQ